MDLILTIRPGRMHGLVPRFRFDPGWLFVIGGLVLCIAGTLLPAQRNLERLQRQRAQLHHEEAVVQGQLSAREALLRDLDRRQPALIRRLAASQLNLVPEDEEPVLVSSTLNDDIISWVDAIVEVTPIDQMASADSTLRRIMSGRHRLWFLMAGVMSVFIGLLLDPSLTGVRRKIALGGPSAAYRALVCRIERTTLDDLIARIELLRSGWQIDLTLAGRHPLVGGIVRPKVLGGDG